MQSSPEIKTSPQFTPSAVPQHACTPGCLLHRALVLLRNITEQIPKNSNISNGREVFLIFMCFLHASFFLLCIVMFAFGDWFLKHVLFCPFHAWT